jgi:hypothetical protein
MAGFYNVYLHLFSCWFLVLGHYIFLYTSLSLSLQPVYPGNVLDGLSWIPKCEHVHWALLYLEPSLKLLL